MSSLGATPLVPGRQTSREDPFVTTATAALERAVDALLPSIRAHANETEGARGVPDDLFDELREAGMFRMLVPERYGGLGIDFPTSVELLQRIARADGAVGWSLMIWSETPQLLALLSKPVFEQVYAAGPDVVVAGAFAPKGKAERADGGYVASGQWGFASGCRQADWLFGNCVIAPDDDDATPALRCMLMPRDAWQILDTWHTVGLRGTGSHDVVLDRVFVPESHAFDLFGGVPCLDDPCFDMPLLQFSMHIGAVAVGIARGAVDDLTSFAGTGKTRLYGRTAMIESELFQHRLGHADASVRAAQSYLEREAATHWRLAREGHGGAEHLTDVLQTVAWVASTCVAAVDLCYTVGGGSSVYDSSPLQRRLRDIHTLSQHASVQEGAFANSGAALLGVARHFAP